MAKISIFQALFLNTPFCQTPVMGGNKCLLFRRLYHHHLGSNFGAKVERIFPRTVIFWVDEKFVTLIVMAGPTLWACCPKLQLADGHVFVVTILDEPFI